jgi:hypothetical protein
VRLTIDLGADPERLAGCLLGWPPYSTACSRCIAMTRLGPCGGSPLEIDDSELFRTMGSWAYRAWYAALWAEAVIDHHPNATARVQQSRHDARDNPIATAMVERAAVITTGDRETLARLAITFARLGCPYQQARTARMAAGPLAQG